MERVETDTYQASEWSRFKIDENWDPRAGRPLVGKKESRKNAFKTCWGESEPWIDIFKRLKTTEMLTTLMPVYIKFLSILFQVSIIHFSQISY